MKSTEVCVLCGSITDIKEVDGIKLCECCIKKIAAEAFKFEGGEIDGKHKI